MWGCATKCFFTTDMQWFQASLTFVHYILPQTRLRMWGCASKGIFNTNMHWFLGQPHIRMIRTPHKVALQCEAVPLKASLTLVWTDSRPASHSHDTDTLQTIFRMRRCATMDNKGIGNAVHAYWRMLDTITWLHQSLRITYLKGALFSPLRRALRTSRRSDLLGHSRIGLVGFSCDMYTVAVR